MWEMCEDCVAGLGETRVSQELSGEGRNENQVFTYKSLGEGII